MTSQIEAFEAIAKELSWSLNFDIGSDGQYKSIEMQTAWLWFQDGIKFEQADQAANIAELTESLGFCKGSNLRLDKANDDLEETIAQLQLDNARMREALEDIAKVNHSSAKCGDIASEALLTRPTLAEYKVADEALGEN